MNKPEGTVYLSYCVHCHKYFETPYMYETECLMCAFKDTKKVDPDTTDYYDRYNPIENREEPAENISESDKHDFAEDLVSVGLAKDLADALPINEISGVFLPTQGGLPIPSSRTNPLMCEMCGENTAEDGDFICIDCFNRVCINTDDEWKP